MADNAVLEQIFSTLNLQQQIAVKYDANMALQVIAGPGTGKTKVLTSRVAYLMLYHKIRPQDIIVTTFTNKAAKEMIDRLVLMLRDTSIRVSDLMIGTFHSVCLRILSKYGHRIGLMKDWRIIDEKEIDVIVHNMVEKMPDQIRDYALSLRRKVNLCLPKNGSDEWTVSPKLVKRQFERIKSYAILPEEYKSDDNHDTALAYFYEAYQNELNRLNALDFDDLLMYAFRLLTREKCLPRIRHVLVDEFQDTNGIQMDLMFLFSRGNHHLSRGMTVVGDPDQSIYAFRNALAYNFQEMFKRCPIECSRVVLVENYRSSQKILDTSEALIRQQTEGRTDRSPLHAQYDCIFAPVYLNFPASFLESPSIVREMLYLKSLPNLFTYDDFAILVRQRRQIKKIETALIEHRVPYKILKGHAFWELKETTSMINLLKCVYSENEKNAMIAALQYPAKGIGPTTAERLRTAIENNDNSPFDTLRRIRDGKIKFDMIGKARTSLADFVNMIEACKKLREESINVALKEIFDKLYEFSGMKQEYLYFDGKKKEDRKSGTEPNYLNSRHKNVLVLKDYFLGVTSGNEDDDGASAESVSNTTVGSNNDKNDPVMNLNTVMEHFRNFFLSLTIYSNDAEESEEINAIKKQKYSEGLVTVSTIHGAKGLEWPVVFIPGCEEGIIPSLFGDGRSSNLEGDDDDDSANESDEEQKHEKPLTDNNGTKKKVVVPDDSLNEERRMFFVAQTRAKHLLYLSSVTDKDGRIPAVPSRFLTKELLSTMVDKQRALESVTAIKALYVNVGKKYQTLNSAFSFQQLVNDYTDFVENRRERFIWAGSFVRGIYQCNMQRNIIPTNVTNEFTTAAIQLKTSVASPEKMKLVSPEKFAPTNNRSDEASPVKTHAPMKSPQTPAGSPTKKKSFAPSYIPGRNGPNTLGINRRLFAPNNERPQLQKGKNSPAPLNLSGTSQKNTSTPNWKKASPGNEVISPVKSENAGPEVSGLDSNHSSEDHMDFPASDDELMAISDLKSKTVVDSAMVEHSESGLMAVTHSEPKSFNPRKPKRKLVAAPIDISEKGMDSRANDDGSEQKSRFFTKKESENTTAAELLHNPDDVVVDNRPIIANAKTLADAVRETSAGSQKGKTKVKKEPTPSQYDIFSQLNNAKKKAKKNDGEIIVID